MQDRAQRTEQRACQRRYPTVALCGALLLAGLLPACATRQTEAPPGRVVARSIPESLYCTPRDWDEDDVETPRLAKHVLALDNVGEVIDPWVRAGKPNAVDFPAYVRGIFAAYAAYRVERRQAGKPAKLLFYVNGGLNGNGTALRRAVEQTPCMRRAGYFPVFLIWNSAFTDTYWEQISHVRHGRRYDTPRATTPVYFLADLGQGIARAPATYLNMLGGFLETTGDSLDSLFEGDGAERISDSTPLLVHYDGPEQSAGRFAGNAALFALTAPVKLVTTPFVDAFGKTAWENMLRRTRNTLRRPREFEPENRDLAEMARYPRGTGGFSKFFAEIERCVRRDPECLAPTDDVFSDAEISLIAHSMGAVIVNDLIRYYDEIPYRNVVYMGAACSVRQFLETVAPVMNAQLTLEFYDLMLHPVADGREVTGQGLAPSGSLLEWVDEMYEGPPTMLDRTLGKWVNVEVAAYAFPAHLRDRLHFRVFGFRPADPARRDPGDPTAHSDFNDTEMHYWLPDFWDGAGLGSL